MANRKTIDCFIENLAYYSYEKKITIPKLAKLLKVSQSTISMWRTGKAFPRIEVLEKMADCFGVTVSDLVSDNEYIKTEQPQAIATQFDEDTYTNEELNEKYLLKDYRVLNIKGKKEARKRVQELTEIPRYTDIPQLNAAHAIEDASADDKAFDEDIMDDENF